MKKLRKAINLLYIDIKKWLKEKYKNEQKFNWEILIGLYALFVLMGFLYLDSFFKEYVISYKLFFNINDCIDILYKKGGLLFYLLTFTVVSLSSFSIFFFVKKRQKSINNKKMIYTILKIMIVPAIIIFVFFVYRGYSVRESIINCGTYIISSKYLFFWK